MFNAPTAPFQTSGKASHEEQGGPAAEVCASLLSRKSWGRCHVWHVRVCPVRAEAGAEPSRENHLTLPVHKWLGEFPPVGVWRRGAKVGVGCVWPRWPMPSEMGDSTSGARHGCSLIADEKPKSRGRISTSAAPVPL